MLRLSRLLVVQKSLSPGEQQGLTAALRDRAVLFIGFFFFILIGLGMTHHDLDFSLSSLMCSLTYGGE